MDPFSITAGVIGVVDGGLSLSKMLVDRVKDFNKAEEQIMELAHEVDLCSTLLDELRPRLNLPRGAYPKNLVSVAEVLITRMSETMDSIRKRVQAFDTSKANAAKYALFDAGTLRGHHGKLKGLQTDFMCLLCVFPAQSQVTAPAMGISGLAGLGSLEGTIQHIPIYSNSRDPSSGGPVTYQATLTLRPAPTQPAGIPSPPAPAPSGGPAQSAALAQQLQDLKRDKVARKKLANLTSSPFFQLGDIFGSKKSRRSQPVSPDPRSRHRMRTSDPEERAFMRKAADDETTEYYALDPSSDYMGPIESRSALGGDPSARKVDAMLDYLLEEDDNESYDISEDETLLKTYTGPDTTTGAPRAPPSVVTTDYSEVNSLDPESRRRPSPYDTASPSRYEAQPERDGDSILLPFPPDIERIATCGSCEIKFTNSMVRFECDTCPDFTFCKTCYRTPVRKNAHEHQEFTRVDPGSKPRAPPHEELVPTSPSTHGRGPPQPRAKNFHCDGCRKPIPADMPRYECASCTDFDFCERCFHDPEQTMRHQHSKRYFVTRLPNRSRKE
ncbi:hypothetical protein LTR56_021867 [Elasticomyces elasticus]|nr:hypothetical protein LTR56_021867 [Elasticomyces elasticus]KAK3641668.1 hypothetical protein LTR22_016486 [Elasticomyces elasticus]KAK4907981.1 hypothetical protein LTR49_023079 [Elasticomyces elasticus]KAK5739478.1 hypothetical protein LTS12_025259 [Elasticomyces elasticus]